MISDEAYARAFEEVESLTDEEMAAAVAKLEPPEPMPEVERPAPPPKPDWPELTVDDLVALLGALPPHLPVEIEGCDCIGDACGVELYDDCVMIRREDGCITGLGWTK